ncbi:MarR family winged helix-turn-helix transcriptional regulator [Nocardioides yefusunii]|uniref:MarR family winged helix-turn-helix transcriptional regulator n=1 Tax=Nocardioides yefusunii TaxID=2500546 RepID=A0ABW1QZ07_9ACTN|nr:MarR family transcriptional regulator [Nocardioides yefusunii]
MNDTQARLDVWLAILQIQSVRMKKFESWLRSEHEITGSQYEILRHLADAPDGMRMQQLSGAILYSSGATTNVVRRLEFRGLVERHPVAHDARGVHVHLTDDGVRLVDAVRALHHTHVVESLPEFTDAAERRAVLSYLSRACADQPASPVRFRPPLARVSSENARR